MSMRGIAPVAGLVLGLGLATAVSCTAIGLVGDEVAPAGSGRLSQAEVERRISTALDGAPSRGTTGPSWSPAGPTPSLQKSVVARGGTVILQCTGSRITARHSPGPGYSESRATTLDGGHIEVEFENETRWSTVEGSCRDGVPVAQVEESEAAEDD